MPDFATEPAVIALPGALAHGVVNACGSMPTKLVANAGFEVGSCVVVMDLSQKVRPIETRLLGSNAGWRIELDQSNPRL
jgi:hypothetical protein